MMRWLIGGERHGDILDVPNPPPLRIKVYGRRHPTVDMDGTASSPVLPTQEYRLTLVVRGHLAPVEVYALRGMSNAKILETGGQSGII